MKRLHVYILSAVLGTVMVSTSCSDQLDQVNPNAQTESTFWKTQSDFDKALVACYSPTQGGH